MTVVYRMRRVGQSLVEAALVLPILLALFAIVLLLVQWLAVSFTVIRVTENAAQQIVYRPQRYNNGEQWSYTQASIATWQMPTGDVGVKDVVLYGLDRPWIMIGLQRVTITLSCLPDRRGSATCARYRPFRVDVELVTSPWIPPLIPIPELTFRHTSVGIFQQQW